MSLWRISLLVNEDNDKLYHNSKQVQMIDPASPKETIGSQEETDLKTDDDPLPWFAAREGRAPPWLHRVFFAFKMERTLQNDFLGVPWTSIYESATFRRCKKVCVWEDGAIQEGPHNDFEMAPSPLRSDFFRVIFSAWSRYPPQIHETVFIFVSTKNVPERIVAILVSHFSPRVITRKNAKRPTKM